MQPAPKSFRLHIGIFGRRNAGKSSLLNALTRQQVSIVSEIAGTTTDPVEKPMELLPIGPVLFIDTAGIDDAGALGQLRVEKTRQVFDRTDVGIVVAAAGQWDRFEEMILRELEDRKVPALVVFNKADLARPAPELVQRLKGARDEGRGASGEGSGFRVQGSGGDERSSLTPSPRHPLTPSPPHPSSLVSHPSSLIPHPSPLACVETVATTGMGLLDLRAALIAAAPEEFINAPSIVSDLVPPGELVVLVVPIDKEAPKGRLIQPQVQTIRDLLDGDAYCMVVKERELRDALQRLNRPPALVVTDSQAFLKVAADTPPEVKMTSFSILFARQKGDLAQFVQGAMAIERLRPGDRVLVAEACSHHPIADDIGRVKIPRWLQQYVGGKLQFSTTQGHDFPADLSSYGLVVHCGACMWNRREVLTRMLRCRQAGVPICNYGMTIAYTLGIFDRALEPFPDALETFRRLQPERR